MADFGACMRVLLLAMGLFFVPFLALAQTLSGNPSLVANNISPLVASKAGFKISNIHTYWQSFENSNGAYVCSPGIFFTVQSLQGDVGLLSVTVNFVDETNESVFSNSATTISNLPSGLSEVASAVGVTGLPDNSQGYCYLSSSVPSLTAEVTLANITGGGQPVLAVKSLINGVVLIPSLQNYIALQSQQ
jgi:hypothetical protein